MADLTITPKWNTAINMVENGQVISGGVNGNANIATRQLGENIFFLFDAMNIIQSTMETSQSVDAKIQNLITGTIGELSSLQTSNKSNIVAAINEILNTGSAGTAYVDNSINNAKTEMTNLMTQKDDALRTELLADIQQNVDDLTVMINDVGLNNAQDFQTITSDISQLQFDVTGLRADTDQNTVDISELEIVTTSLRTDTDENATDITSIQQRVDGLITASNILSNTGGSLTFDYGLLGDITFQWMRYYPTASDVGGCEIPFHAILNTGVFYISPPTLITSQDGIEGNIPYVKSWSLTSCNLSWAGAPNSHMMQNGIMIFVIGS